MENFEHLHSNTKKSDGWKGVKAGLRITYKNKKKSTKKHSFNIGIILISKQGNFGYQDCPGQFFLTLVVVVLKNYFSINLIWHTNTLSAEYLCR